MPNLAQYSSDSQDGLRLEGRLSDPRDPQSFQPVFIAAEHVFFNRAFRPGTLTMTLVRDRHGYTHYLSPESPYRPFAQKLASLLTAPWSFPVLTPELQAFFDMLGVDPRDPNLDPAVLEQRILDVL